MRQIIIHIVSNGAFRRALTYSERITSLDRFKAEILACFYLVTGTQNRNSSFFVQSVPNFCWGSLAL